MKFFAKRVVARQLNELKNRSAFKPKEVRRLVIIHDTDLNVTESQLNDIIQFFSPKCDSVEHIHYNINKKMLEGMPRPHLHPQSMDWRGALIGEDLLYVLDQPYDLVLHFVEHITLPLISFSAQLKASFRIGPSTLDERLNDLVLPPKTDFGAYLIELKKYFNKIHPNEFS